MTDANFLKFLKTRFKSYMFLNMNGDMNEYEKNNYSAWITNPVNASYPTDFDHKVNYYGFRDTQLSHVVDTCYYGCSITFGYGVHIDARWTSVLDRECKSTSNNFGVNGLGVNEISNLFTKSSQIVTMNRAIFLLPNLHRATMLIEDEYLPVHVHYADSPHRDVFKNYWSLPDSYLIDALHNNIETILYVAKLKGIEVFFSSWDDQVYNELDRYNRLPMFPENDREGRDGTHPGIAAHKTFADRVLLNI
jgi:hypothetical protein